MLDVRCKILFISNQYFVLNLSGSFGVLSKKLIIFDIQLLYYYIKYQIVNNFLSFFRYLYLSLGISLSFSFVTISELFCCEFFLNLLNYINNSLIPIKSPVASAVFWIALFEGVLSASVADSLAWSTSFDCIHYSSFYF